MTSEHQQVNPNVPPPPIDPTAAGTRIIPPANQTNTWNADLRQSLRIQLKALEQKLVNLAQNRQLIDKLLAEARKDADTVRAMFEYECRRLGVEEELPETSDLRFIGMGLTDIADVFLSAGRLKEQMLLRLKAISYPFETENHIQSVNIAWVNAERRKKGDTSNAEATS